jgi:glutathione S-transferase
MPDGRPCLLANRFSAADVYLGNGVARGLQFGTLPTRPCFAGHVARTATKRPTAIDDALMAHQG